MSAIASFIQLPKSAIEGLREAAIPKKKLFGRTVDGYWEYLKRNERASFDYQWSGYVVAVLLPYLQELHQIDLMHSEDEELSNFLTKARSSTHFILNETHKKAYLAKLSGEFSKEEMNDYYNEFNGVNQSEVGGPMLDGIECLRKCLSSLDDQSIVLLMVG